LLADLCPLIYDGGKGGGAQRTSSSAIVEIDRVTIRSVVSVDRLILTVTRPSIVQIYLISETIQDMTTTTVENEYELLCDLSKGAIFNDFAEVICLLTAQARNRRTDKQTEKRSQYVRSLRTAETKLGRMKHRFGVYAIPERNTRRFVTSAKAKLMQSGRFVLSVIFSVI